MDQLGILGAFLYSSIVAYPQNADEGFYGDILDRFGREEGGGTWPYNDCTFAENGVIGAREGNGWWLIRNFNEATTVGSSSCIMVVFLAIFTHLLVNLNGYDNDLHDDPHMMKFLFGLKVISILNGLLLINAAYSAIVLQRYWSIMTVPNYALEKGILNCSNVFKIGNYEPAAGLLGDDPFYIGNPWGYTFSLSALFCVYVYNCVDTHCKHGGNREGCHLLQASLLMQILTAKAVTCCKRHY